MQCVPDKTYSTINKSLLITCPDGSDITSQVCYFRALEFKTGHCGWHWHHTWQTTFSENPTASRAHAGDLGVYSNQLFGDRLYRKGMLASYIVLIHLFIFIFLSKEPAVAPILCHKCENVLILFKSRNMLTGVWILDTSWRGKVQNYLSHHT